MRERERKRTRHERTHQTDHSKISPVPESRATWPDGSWKDFRWFLRSIFVSSFSLLFVWWASRSGVPPVRLVHLFDAEGKGRESGLSFFMLILD